MAEQADGHDLRALFRAIGSKAHGGTLAGEEERKIDESVELLDKYGAEITADVPLIRCAIDGIQSQMILTFIEQRPVLLAYTASGALSPVGSVLGVRERLTLICSSVDRPWADSLGSTVPIEELGAVTPPEVEREALTLLNGSRDVAEQVILRDLLESSGVSLEVGAPVVPGAEASEQIADSGGFILVDGSLGSRPADLRLIGVSKTVGKRYLDDESVLFGLRQGYRSVRFFIPPGVTGGVGRYSTYLRLNDARGEKWSHGLVRIEAHDPSLLDEACAFALSNKQGRGSIDGRWDRHLKIVRSVEDLLRARRPAVFSLGR